MTPYLRIQNLCCNYGENMVLRGFDLELNPGEIGSILGPSGCGKTSVLRAISGFLAPVSGEIHLDGRLLSGTDTMIPSEQRNLGMVYQDYALFPHLNVLQNICFGIYKKPKSEQQTIAETLLDLIQLNGYENRMPAELSGGQQQRVALARSLATDPGIILLDEPFSGLDAELRRELSLAVKDILKKRGTTALLVTHDQEEAFAMADRIGVVSDGQIKQWGTAYELYHQPTNRFVADFVGRGSFLPGVRIDQNAVETEIGLLQSSSQSNHDDAGEKVDLLVRPDDLTIDEQGNIRGMVTKKLFVGRNSIYQLELASGSKLEAMLPSHSDFQIGDELSLSIDTPHLISFPALN